MCGGVVFQGWLNFLTPDFVKAARETCPTECVFTNEQVCVFIYKIGHNRRNMVLPKGVCVCVIDRSIFRLTSINRQLFVLPWIGDKKYTILFTIIEYSFFRPT